MLFLPDHTLVFLSEAPRDWAQSNKQWGDFLEPGRIIKEKVSGEGFAVLQMLLWGCRLPMSNSYLES